MSDRLRRTLTDQVQPSHAAVVVIDPQKDFCASDGIMGRLWGLDMTSIQEAVPRLNRFVTAARSSGVPVVWVREVFSPSRMLPNAKVLNGDGDDLVLIREGGDGIDWYGDVIGPRDDETVFTKWNYDAFENSDLDLWLRSAGIETLVFTGFTSNVCVETSARHAYIKGYYVVVVSDCTAAPVAAEHDAAMVNIGKYFGRAETAQEVIRCWGGRDRGTR